MSKHTDKTGQPIQYGNLVIVDTEGGKPGQVRGFDGGMVLVSLANEKGRMDSWNVSQIRVVDSKEAAKASLRFVSLTRRVEDEA